MPPHRFSCFLIGTESLLISCAETLLESGQTVLGVVSDEPQIVAWGTERGIRVLSRQSPYANALREQPFDYLLSITNLAMLPAEVLVLPRKGAINFHDGPLPRYGGLYAPAWALMAGEREYGITWHRMVDEADAGAIVLQRRFAIEPSETSLSLNTKCFEAGVESFPELVELLTEGGSPTAEHTLDRTTNHGRSARPSGLATIEPGKSATEMAALLRALDFGGYPNPLTTGRLVANGAAVLVHGPVGEEPAAGTPGTLRADGTRLLLALEGGTLVLDRLMDEDGRPLDAEEALRHLKLDTSRVLPMPDPARLEAVDAFSQRFAKYDEAWAGRLLRLDPLELPYAERTSGRASGRARLPMPRTDDAVRHAMDFVLFVARLGGRGTFDLAFREHGKVGASADTAADIAAAVPFRVTLQSDASVADARAALTREIEGAHAHGGFARDIAVRHPRLKALAGRPFTLPIGIELVERLDDVVHVGSDLTLVIAEDGSVAWDYDPGVLDAARIMAMAAQFAACTMDDAAPWVTLPLLSADERHQVVDAWATAVRDVPRDHCVHELIAAQAARTPDAIAVVFEDTQLSYRELDARANQLAHHLRGLGAGPDTLVAICCERSLDMMIGMLGIQKAGAAYVPIDPAYPADRIAYMLEDSQAQIVVTQEPVLGALPDSRATVVCLDREWTTIAQRPDTAPVSGATAANLAYCIYTSGSTGRPKGVMVEHRNVVNFFGAMDERLGTDAGVWLAVTSLSFDISVLELLWTLSRGYKVVIYADENRSASVTAGLANTHKGVGFSLFYFSADENENKDNRYRVLMEGARFGDKHGFTAVWTPERHFHAFGGLYPNPAVTGAAVAAVTSRIGIRAGSCVLPLHHPVRVAEEWAVVDNLSAGRVGISFAAGWQPNDFIFQPQNFADAKQKTVEMIDTVRRLWRGETLSFPGPRGDVAVRTLPRPVQAELPIWFTTAGNPESYELAGKLGVHVLTHLLGQSVDELADKITLYRKAWKAAGHAGDGQVSLMLHTFVGDSDQEVKDIVRAPMKAYLSTSISLIKGFASAFPTFKKGKDGQAPELDFASLSADEMDALLEYSFERYYETSGLFGTVETCAKIVDRLKGIGVDDVACLIDFGIESERVLAHLRHLNRLRALVSRPRAAFADYSVAALIARHRVTHLQCTPSMAGMLVANDRSRDALRSLRVMCVGGEAFPPSLAAELHRIVPGDINNMYGPTETTIWSAMHTVSGSAETIPLGKPLANNELYVLDAFRQPVPPGVAGELYIGGAQVVRGYWRRHDLTIERFVPHPFRRDPAARLYRTGDLVRWRPDGTLEFLGRVDFQVKVRGYRIELGEIEAALAGHPDVREAVVVARDDDKNGDVRLVGYVVWKKPVDNGATMLREHLRASLPEFMVPSHFVTLRDMPRTPNQKIDRKALPAPASAVATQAAATTQPPVAPSGELEPVIATIWQEVLKLPHVGVADNFFDLGGHSLLAVQVHSKLKKALGRDLAITDLFRFPTIRGLANFLGGAQDGAAVKSGIDRAAQRREMASRRVRRES